MADSIQNMSDAELLSAAKAAFITAAANPTAYGFTVPEIAAMQSRWTQFSTDVAANTSAQAAARAAVQAKNASHNTTLNDLRNLRNHGRTSGASETDMAALGLPVGSDVIAATVPLGIVDTGVRLRHTLSWGDAGTPNSRKRPGNATAVEIWRKIDGPPPADQSECNFVAIDTASPYTIDYSGDDGNKVAHYMLRWHLRDGSSGGWGDTVSDRNRVMHNL